LKITVRQLPARAEGSTHAISVIPVVRSSELLSLTVTQSLMPSNDRALPYLPAVVHAAPLTVPPFALPETSARSRRSPR
jgi:hypothetical protein